MKQLKLRVVKIAVIIAAASVIVIFGQVFKDGVIYFLNQ